jgi:signal transduction histidine kinase
MIYVVWLLVGAVLSAPVWIALTAYAGRRLWRATRRLSAKTRGKERFIELGHLVGGLAHEVKNPLSTINVNLKLLAEDLSRHGDEEHRRLAARVDRVRAESARIREILDDFLRFAGKCELAPIDADLRELVEELLDFFAPQAEAANVVLRSSLPDGPLPARVDVNLLKQALLNLMINAVQAMGDGGELLVRLTSQRGRAVMEVIDTGPGIPPEVLPRVFDAYYSTKPGGSGLGLPTTNRIVREHGGEIVVESEVGKGTRFVLKLPLAQERR